MDAEINVLSALRWFESEAHRGISEREGEIRALSAFLEHVGSFLQSPDAAFFSQMRLPAGIVPEMKPGSPLATTDEGYFQQMRSVLPALRAANGHLPRLRLLAVAAGGKLSLDDAADFLLNEGISDAKDVESLAKNLGTTINKDTAHFARDPENKRTYYLKSIQQPPEPMDGQTLPEAPECEGLGLPEAELPEFSPSPQVNGAEPS